MQTINVVTGVRFRIDIKHRDLNCANFDLDKNENEFIHRTAV